MAGLVVRKSGLPDLRHSRLTDLGEAEVLCIHALLCSQGVDARDTGERSDAVLRTAMRGHDVERVVQTNWKPLQPRTHANFVAPAATDASMCGMLPGLA